MVPSLSESMSGLPHPHTPGSVLPTLFGQASPQLPSTPSPSASPSHAVSSPCGVPPAVVQVFGREVCAATVRLAAGLHGAVDVLDHIDGGAVVEGERSGLARRQGTVQDDLHGIDVVFLKA